MPQLATAADTKYQLQLPKVSFRVVDDDRSSSLPSGVHSEQFRHFGYNDFSDFERPDFFIRYIEPIESELAKQVEYDMDEQDQEWLDAINAERKKEQSGPIPYEVFEIIMDKLEKEWFALSKRIPQPASHMPVEDSKCAICDDGEGENSNAIVFCDGCNLAVHQDCYGVPYIPEGQWLCRKCTVSPGNPVSCLFCPNEGGAFKQTNTGHWSHLLCGMWIPELFMGNVVYMEPVEGVEAIPKSRWKLICSLCRERVGACIQCEKSTCFTAFHVTCARQMGFLTTMKSMGQQDGPLKAYCEKHLPDEFRKEDVLALSEVGSDYAPSSPHSPNKRSKTGSGIVMKKARGGSAIKKANSALTTLPSPVITTKTARAHAKSYRPGPPIVPHIIVQSVIDYVAKINIRKRQGLVERVCRYWSLKREARRGAPLLKRLHLEPWTANADPKQQTDAEKQLKLQFIAMLRSDLEKVRMLAEQVRKREKKKLAQAQVIKDVVDGFLFRGDGRLRLTLEKISAMDKTELFLNPVSSKDVPDYHTVIKEPMCWLAIDDKLDKNAYTSVDEFERDINLTLTNAMAYNGPESAYHRTAKRIHTNAQPLLAELDTLAEGADLLPYTGVEGQGGEEYDLKLQEGLVGDLEASLLQLYSLVQPALATSPAAKDVLDSLFKFELEPPKEPTPPPPSPPKKLRISAAEKKAKWDEREAKHKERMAMRGAMGRGSGRLSGVGMEGAGGSDGQSPDVMVEDLQELPMPVRTRGRRSLAGPATTTIPGPTEADADIKPSDTKMIDEAALAAARRQRGVVGLETVAVLTDRERRRQEKALDIVTEEVDGRDQFKRFNVGWVLPEGSKRRRGGDMPRGESPVTNAKGKRPASTGSSHDEPASSALTSANRSGQSSTTPVPPPKRRGRPPKIRPLEIIQAEAASAIEPPLASSPLSSAMSESGDSLTPEAEAEAEGDDALEGDAVKMEVDGQQDEICDGRDARGKQSQVVPKRRGRPLLVRPVAATPGNDVDSTPRVSQDGPRAKRRRLNDGSDTAASATPAPQPTRPSRGRRAKERLVEYDDDEDDITPMASDEDAADAVQNSRAGGKAKADGGQGGKNGKAVIQKTDTQEEEEDEENPFPPTTLVWARQTSYPYFPAEIIDYTDDDMDIPPAVLDLQPDMTNEVFWLIRFFDAQASYAWIPRKRLDMLGEDDAIDQMYLQGKERGRSGMFKSANMKRAVQKGYREAMALKALTDEE